MREAIIEIGTQVVLELLLMLIGVVFAYMSRLLAKTKKLEHVAAAMDELEKVVKIVVGDLQQTVVDGLKEKTANGKLTKEDIEWLGNELYEKVVDQVSSPAVQTLGAAGVDIENMIHSMAEAYIARIKRENNFIALGEVEETA